jgi:hypothetical protein
MASSQNRQVNYFLSHVADIKQTNKLNKIIDCYRVEFMLIFWIYKKINFYYSMF